ncbi:MAG: glycosyltransferase [Rhodocyclaceae bacterium]|nr:glycosyltransferase [Rhodocyclaceae bacterium]
MNPLISQANLSFMNGDFATALSHYDEFISRYGDLADVPHSLITHCRQRVKECNSRRESPHDARAKGATQIPPGRTRTIADDGWTTDYFFTEKPSSRLPLVSIVIPHYNSGGLVFQALDSIAAQNFHDVETLIIDDVSTDKSLSKTRLDSYPAWMQLTLISLKSNGGPARARNIGVRLSRGRGICFLDADDWLDASTLEERWRVVNSDPVVAAAFSTMSYADQNRKPLGPVILKGSYSFSYSDFISNKFPCSALLFRRRALAIDPFDESLVYGEDYDCFSRIAQRGGVYRIAPGTVWYRQHENSLTHKDALKDLLNRVAITRRVHARELKWSLVNYTRTLPEALVVKETSMRAFPIACIYALRSQPDKATQLGAHIDPDVVASQQPITVAGSLRFFITREEFLPADQLTKLLARSDIAGLRRFLANFFSVRHQPFLSELIKSLLPESSGAVTIRPVVAAAPFVECAWEQFLKGPDAGGGWRGYVILHRSDEHMPRAAQSAAAEMLTGRLDLEGLFASRLNAVGNEMLVDVDSIGPADPDSAEIQRLGNDLAPAIVLHELAATTLWAWLVHPAQGTVEALTPGADAATIERRALQGVRALRLKIAGGVAACHVLRNQRQEAPQ